MKIIRKYKNIFALLSIPIVSIFSVCVISFIKGVVHELFSYEITDFMAGSCTGCAMYAVYFLIINLKELTNEQ